MNECQHEWVEEKAGSIVFCLWCDSKTKLRMGILEAAVLAERERIIKLLEDNKHEEGRFIFLDYAIALIKGENK
jgi:hypothetical protein